MPLRVLQHGFAGTTPSVGLETGRWSDVRTHGQFLMDLEFLLRYGPKSGTASCVYCKSPPYLTEIAQQFPWIHFYVFEHKPPPPAEYDPAEPSLVCSAPLTVQVEYNKTTSCMEFTKDMARTMGERGARERESLLMICHGQDVVKQLVFHVLMRPCYSFLDICGTIPVDYLDGELMLPIYLPNNKIFLGLVASQHAKCKTYDPEIFLGEIGESAAFENHLPQKKNSLTTWKGAGFFQGVIRATQAYDDTSKDVITGEYAKSTHAYHQCPEEILKTALESTVDLLWAMPEPPKQEEDPNLQSAVELLQTISQLLPLA